MSRPSTDETLYEFPRPKSGGGAHNYQLLQQDAGWTAFLAESATSVVDMEWQTVNPNLMPIEEFRKFSPFRQFHEDTLKRYRKNLPPTKGRIRDVYLAAAKRVDDNGGSWTVYFTKENMGRYCFPRLSGDGNLSKLNCWKCCIAFDTSVSNQT